MTTTQQSRWKRVGASLLDALPALVLLALFGWGAYELLRVFVDYLQGLKSDLATAFVASAAAVVGAVLSLTIGKAYETRTAIRSDLRQKKTPVYERIIATLFEFVFASVLKKPQMEEAKLLQFFATTTEKLTIWGSDDVLKAWGEFKKGTEGDPFDMMFRFENLVLAIRKDLGHQNRGIGTTSILRLFINDMDEFLATERSAKSVTSE